MNKLSLSIIILLALNACTKDSNTILYESEEIDWNAKSKNTLPIEKLDFDPEETTSFMVNPNATEETIALFYNLKLLSQSGFIIGQQDAFSSFYQDNIGDSDIK
tara:strand:- start:28717 stop:29028 length:312 start_codon:yes stop_codon:yes gene_type:complete